MHACNHLEENSCFASLTIAVFSEVAGEDTAENTPRLLALAGRRLGPSSVRDAQTASRRARRPPARPLPILHVGQRSMCRIGSPVRRRYCAGRAIAEAPRAETVGFPAEGSEPCAADAGPGRRRALGVAQAGREELGVRDWSGAASPYGPARVLSGNGIRVPVPDP